MKGHTVLLVLVGVAAVAALGLWGVAASGEAPGHAHKEAATHEPVHKGWDALADFAKAHHEKLQSAVASLDAVKKAIEGNDTKTALAELAKARELVAAAHAELAKALPKAVVNVRCPILGTAIDPGKAPDDLIREYKGKKVAFCCPGCPQAWDKLTDEQKDAKLAKALAEPEKK